MKKFGCEYAKKCRYYDPEGYNCTRGGEDYCGAYKAFEKERT